MQMRLMCLAILIVGLAFVLGCGGGNGVAQDPGGGDVGTASGGIDPPAGSPADYQLTLDGQPIPIRPAADGRFVIPNVPAGDHIVEAIGPDGLHGGRAQFNIRPGDETEIPPIRPALGGQIVGMVMKRDDSGLTPLAGVEVVARSDLIWILTEDGRTTVGPMDAAGPAPLIYPPPEGVTYKAVTERDGSYAMKAVKPGPYLVTVVVPGLTAGEAFVWVEPGRTAVADFVLHPFVEPGVGTVQGIVTSANAADGSKTPIEGARVEVFPDSPWRPPPPTDPIRLPPDVDFPGMSPRPAADTGPEPGIVPPDVVWRVFRTLTDKDGRYSLDVPTGRCEISVFAYEYFPEWRRLVVKNDAVLTEDFALRKLPPPPNPRPGPRPLPGDGG